MSEVTNVSRSIASLAPDRPAVEPVSGEEYVRWAYRLLLGREPESVEAVRQHPFKNDARRLVQSVLNSEEFRAKRLVGMPLTDHGSPYTYWHREAQGCRSFHPSAKDGRPHIGKSSGPYH